MAFLLGAFVVASLRVAYLQVAFLLVASLRVASLRVAFHQVVLLLVASIRVVFLQGPSKVASLLAASVGAVPFQVLRADLMEVVTFPAFEELKMVDLRAVELVVLGMVTTMVQRYKT